ncbi:response regulator transcription factor [Planctomycetota bacterium]
MKHRVTSYISLVGAGSETWPIVREVCKQVNAKVRRFTSVQDCLESLRSQRCDLIIIEMMMHDMDELIILHEFKEISPHLSVLIVYASSSVRAAVTVMKLGAFDLIKKPFSKPQLLSAIAAALEGPTAYRKRARDKKLTPIEKKVLSLILNGKSNRETATILHRSIKTIEVHRSHIMQKFGVDSTVDLIKKAIAMGLTDLP